MIFEVKYIDLSATLYKLNSSYKCNDLFVVLTCKFTIKYSIGVRYPKDFLGLLSNSLCINKISSFVILSNKLFLGMYFSISPKHSFLSTMDGRFSMHTLSHIPLVHSTVSLFFDTFALSFAGACTVSLPPSCWPERAGISFPHSRNPYPIARSCRQSARDSNPLWDETPRMRGYRW